MVRLTAEQREDRAMSERVLKRVVVGMALARGWKVYQLAQDHVFRPMRSSAGYPDLTLARAGNVIWVELKRETEDLEPEQIVWRDALVGGTVTLDHSYIVLRPGDLRGGLVEGLLE